MTVVVVALAISDFVFLVLAVIWTLLTNRRSASDGRWAALIAGTFGVVAVTLGQEAAIRSYVVAVAMATAAAVIATFMWARSWPLSPRMAMAVKASAAFSVFAAVFLAFSSS